uniref:Uncharacterized protein LOC104226201 isoform X1 n=1 Tax=Nicotiana sylvestris TaxID=4096 RepID=A0A1U7WGN5_NICSY|nr:PREDICTED: uncharacterized protein LOC104226201 isoform X1 [Nicotiana sylvestris]
MYIEKNFFDNLFHTVMDDKNRTKDNLKARMDLQEYCRRRELELRQENNRMVKPKASYSFKMDDKRKICDWVRNLRIPDGYASNLSNCVGMKKGKLMYMKSHDCHIFMESLLPIAFSALPERIWKPITEISLFFKDLCSNTLREENLVLMESNIHLMISKLAKKIPCGFFNVMEHLPIHLVREARLGGSVQCRWMYPFESFYPPKATKAVVESMCSFYHAPWRSWSEVPIHIRDRIFVEFRMKCAWSRDLEAEVRVIFFKKCSDRLPDLLQTSRESNTRPNWILDDLWVKLLEYWKSPEFKKKSEQGRAAHLSNKGGSVHTGGSISIAAHQRRLENAKGRLVTHDEVFEETHMKKLKDGTKPTWIEPRAETTHDNFK